MKKDKPLTNYQSWTFDPASRSYTGVPPCTIKDRLDPGYYSLRTNMYGHPEATIIDLRKDNICQFTSGPFESILEEVNSFWQSNSAYERLGITHKRGILLYGPPGCGKSAIVSGIIGNVVERDGVAVHIANSDDIDKFRNAMPAFRQIQGDHPLVVTMEDIEQFCEYDEEDLLELLDGASAVVDSVLFLATTNRIKKVPARIRCRPSRIDTLIEVGYPEENQRAEYVDFLLGSTHTESELQETIASLGEGLSLADIKEVVVANYVFRRDIGETVKRLQESHKESGDE